MPEYKKEAPTDHPQSGKTYHPSKKIPMRAEYHLYNIIDICQNIKKDIDKFTPENIPDEIIFLQENLNMIIDEARSTWDLIEDDLYEDDL